MTPWRLDVVDEIGSTSDALIERAGLGAKHGDALLARRQTRGRGRHGRRWQAPSGNLAISVLLRPGWLAAEVGHAVFVAGLALHETLQDSVSGGQILSLKWPNDLLLDGIKLGGILVEAATNARGDVDWLVIGFGVNLAHAPVLEGRCTACIARPGAQPPDSEETARELLARLDRWMGILSDDGFGAVRTAWLQRAHPIGTPLIVGDRTGYFAGLSEAGHLLLGSGDSVDIIRTGDVIVADV